MKHSNKYNILVIIGCIIGIVSIVMIEVNTRVTHINNVKKTGEQYTTIEWTNEHDYITSSVIDITDEIYELSNSMLDNSNGLVGIEYANDGSITLLTAGDIFLDKPIKYIEEVVNSKPFLELEQYIEDDLRTNIMNKVNSLWTEESDYLSEVIGKDNNVIVKVVKSIDGSNRPNYRIEVKLIDYTLNELCCQEIDNMIAGQGYVPIEISKIGKCTNIFYGDYINGDYINGNKIKPIGDEENYNTKLDVDVCIVDEEIDTISIFTNIYDKSFAKSKELNTLDEYQKAMIERIESMLQIDDLDKAIEETIQEISSTEVAEDQNKPRIIKKKGYDLAVVYQVVMYCDQDAVETVREFRPRIDIIKK